MSTDYKPIGKIKFADLFDGRLEKYGVREHIKEDDSSGSYRCLTDGRNYLWAYGGANGFLSGIARYGGNAPGKILSAIADEFDVDIVSEHQPKFWGFDTQEEWDAAMEKMSEEHDDRLYEQLLHYLRGEEHDFRPDTNGMLMAEIAKNLVDKDPELTSPERKRELLDKVDKTWQRDHCITVTLDEKQLAGVQMMATHEDDLPQA